jgi:hypothetical protein
MPSFSGVWNLVSQYQAKASLLWPQGPGAPTSVSATAGDASATVSFTAPTFTGVPPGITGYLATSSPGGITATGASSPLTVTGLSNGTAYTFGVQATNGVQFGPAGTSGSVTPALPIAVFGGGGNSSGTYVNTIDYVSISTTGNATDFGDLTLGSQYVAACGSATRGVFAGGYKSVGGFGVMNVISYITFSSVGDAIDFGDILATGWLLSGCGSATRGLFGGGDLSSGITNVIQYITYASPGNSIDFGDLTVSRSSASAASSATRSLFGSGYGASGETNVIDYVTTATLGNAIDFGDLITLARYTAALSSSTRAVFGGGQTGSSNGINVMNYVTISSTGNAIDFGDLTLGRRGLGGASSATRGVWGGGNSTDTFTSPTNIVDYISIASVGNATDFGDLTVSRMGVAGCSNANGGL